MDDAGEKYAQQNAAARSAPGHDDRSAAVETLRADIETIRSDPALQQEHVAARVRLGTLEQKLGRLSEAERQLTEAIAIGERQLGAEHPSLGAALNELSRLYIRQANYARAEPVLERLLQIARAKGESHPDVATALAGLAVAKRGLGDDASAERLYRHALRIREDVLAPHHMAIVVTLEQLAETCAARGRVAEALVHLQRALLRRERALGVEHATVHALRDRIADLERSGCESSAAADERPATPSTSATEVGRPSLAPPMLLDLSVPVSSPSTRSPADRRATPVRAQHKRPGELAFLYQPTPAASRPALETHGRVTAPSRSVAVASTTADAATLLSQTRSTTLARTAPPASSMKRTMRFAFAGAAVMVLAIAGFGFSSTARNETERSETEQIETEHAPTPSDRESHSAVVTPASNAGSSASPGASAPEATPSGSHETPMPTDTQATPAADMQAAKPVVPVALPSLRRLIVPKVAMPSVDSLMRAAVKLARDVDSEQIAAGGSLLTPARNDDANVTRPVLITAPTLRFPDELRAQRVEGEVIVQLRVNEKGRVDPSSMRVMQSDHELFTAAVRSVLPRFRFEPARSAAPESKPQSAWVQFRAQFTARN